ncbi:hypothetical protein CPB84DRAFT_1748697 [Gymnopilus junonius]|uniref:Uncharacterized protein n=1 Tax=Gymnopilus junonius TaxID=109634 RepID=A0A9P5NL90_GYMJU|nr:hypothetical protein CPB84DRAFT_1748697 [Gymnopilus junonius]
MSKRNDTPVGSQKKAERRQIETKEDAREREDVEARAARQEGQRILEGVLVLIPADRWKAVTKTRRVSHKLKFNEIDVWSGDGDGVRGVGVGLDLGLAVAVAVVGYKTSALDGADTSIEVEVDLGLVVIFVIVSRPDMQQDAAFGVQKYKKPVAPERDSEEGDELFIPICINVDAVMGDKFALGIGIEP